LASTNRHGSVSTVDDDKGLGDRASVFASGISVVPGVVFFRWSLLFARLCDDTKGGSPVAVDTMIPSFTSQARLE